MMLSELCSLFSFTPQSVVNFPREAFCCFSGLLTLGWTVVMSTKSAATGPLPEARSVQAARGSRPCGRSARRPMALAMRSMVAVRLSFSGPMTALSAKRLSCCMARVEFCNRW
jgi:hypothetical protein